MNDLLSQRANKSQQKASNPYVSAWVSASAGSGKTKVLTDRVLRLLLAGNEPEKIVCLTFTKAAAAEMKNRLLKTLRDWVIMENDELKQALTELTGEEPEDLTVARTLFAKLLDVKGGMNILTIDSFCENLLKRFPLEAGVSPTFEIIEETDAKQLLTTAFIQTIQNPNYAQDLTILSDFINEDSLTDLFFKISKQTAHITQLLEHFGFESVKDKIYENLGVSPSTTAENLQKALCKEMPWEEFKSIYLTKKDTIKAHLKTDDQKAMAEQVLKVVEQTKALDIAKATSAFLHIAFEVLLKFRLQKERKGLLDFNDLIEKTNELLSQSQMTAWVLYKLDGGLDHILIDEAQDTTPDRWKIIKAITEEFFSGQGNKEDKIRTLFVVGDKKQSIYRFLGADANEFEKMKQFFAKRITDSQNEFLDVPLNISFRSTQTVLDLVNRLLKTPEGAKGVLMPNEQATHFAFRTGQAGLVEVWPLEKRPSKQKKDEEKTWCNNTLQITQPSMAKRLSQKIALRIRQMLDNKEILLSENRPIRPADIMILVRSRVNQNIVDELLKALKEQSIPVCGVDTLILTKHIAIQDLMSLCAFLLLPDDDLSLAEVLKSPLFNLTENELFQIAYNREEKSLWANLALIRPELYQTLKQMLAKADTTPPFELFSYFLDALGFRQKLLARLGPETNEMLDEFLNLALKFEKNHVPNLEGFLAYLKADEVKIKRDMDNAEINAVRIMTIHASKGLQSKIVFLPDCPSTKNPKPSFLWDKQLPIWIPEASLRTKLCEELIKKIENDENDEYNRLLYVAITRAEDRVYICGLETGKKTSWYNLIANAIPDFDNNKGIIFQNEQTATQKKQKKQETLLPFYETLPSWYFQKAPQEPVPTKPLSPSKLTEDPAGESPLTPEQEKAMKRGSFIHQLLQFLPQIEPSFRRDFIYQNTPPEMLAPQHLLQLFEMPEMEKLFSKDSKAEVPLVGKTTDGKVICGQIDRLVITQEEVLIVDYKTNHLVPKDKQSVPIAYIEQLNAYKDLLKGIFSGKKVRSFLLWTTDLTIMEI